MGYVSHLAAFVYQLISEMVFTDSAALTITEYKRDCAFQ